MADITLHHLTPRHFYETVKLIKEIPPSFRFAGNKLIISFDDENDLYDRILHLQLFIRELQYSSVPVDLDEFVKSYKRVSQGTYFRCRR